MTRMQSKLSQDTYLSIKRKAATAELLIEEIGFNLGIDLQEISRELELTIADALNPNLFQQDLEDDRHLGQKVSEARKKAGLSQVDLAAKLGITQGQLSRLESGFRAAPQELIKKISEACKKDYNWFFES